jgi:hypothetical protein
MFAVQTMPELDVKTMKVRLRAKKMTWYPKSQCSVNIEQFSSLPDSKKSWDEFFQRSHSDPRIREQRLYFGVRTVLGQQSVRPFIVACTCRMRTYCYFKFSGCNLMNGGIGLKTVSDGRSDSAGMGTVPQSDSTDEEGIGI